MGWGGATAKSPRRLRRSKQLRCPALLLMSGRNRHLRSVTFPGSCRGLRLLGRRAPDFLQLTGMREHPIAVCFVVPASCLRIRSQHGSSSPRAGHCKSERYLWRTLNQGASLLLSKKLDASGHLQTLTAYPRMMGAVRKLVPNPWTSTINMQFCHRCLHHGLLLSWLSKSRGCEH